MTFKELSEELAAQLIDTESISKSFTDAYGPTFYEMSQSALANLDLPDVNALIGQQLDLDSFAPVLQIPYFNSDMPVLDSRIFEVHEPIVRLMEPIQIELPEPIVPEISLLKQGWFWGAIGSGLVALDIAVRLL